MSYLGPQGIAALLLSVNLFAFAAFGIDKKLSEAGSWRISEPTLLGWALIGGTPGAYAGRAFFKHKTRKKKFAAELHGIALFQLVLLLAVLAWYGNR